MTQHKQEQHKSYKRMLKTSPDRLVHPSNSNQTLHEVHNPGCRDITYSFVSRHQKSSLAQHPYSVLVSVFNKLRIVATSGYDTGPALLLDRTCFAALEFQRQPFLQRCGQAVPLTFQGVFVNDHHLEA